MGALEQAKAPVLNEAQRAKLEKGYKAAIIEWLAYANGLFDLAAGMGIDTSKLSQVAPEVDVTSQIDAIDPKKGSLKMKALNDKVNELADKLTANMDYSDGRDYLASLSGNPNAANLIDSWGPGALITEKEMNRGADVNYRMEQLERLRLDQPYLVHGSTTAELTQSDRDIVNNAEEVADLNQLNELGFVTDELDVMLHQAGMDSRITAYNNATNNTTVAIMPTKNGFSYQILDGVSHNGWRDTTVVDEKSLINKTLGWLTPAVLKGRASSAEDLRRQIDDMLTEQNGKYLDPKLVTKIGAPSFEERK